MLTAELSLVNQNVIFMDRQNQLQESNLSEPDALCNFSTNNASADLNHKPEIETKSEIPLDRRGLKQSIKILGNGDNALYRLGDKNVSLGKNRILKKSSDTAQKLMARHWSSSNAEQLECSVGKTCFVKDVIDPMFKLHYGGQMIGLMHKIIGAACDPNHDCTGNTKRETNLKNEMKIVRSLKYPWPDLTSMFLTSRESVCQTARKILDVMSECEDEMDINEVCTCVTDLCTSLAAKNCDSMTCEIIASLVDFIFEQNMFVCKDFLFWLDHWFNVVTTVCL